MVENKDRFLSQTEQEQPRHILSVEVGQDFYPFKGITLEKNLIADWLTGSVRVAEFSFNFKGVNSRLLVSAYPADSEDPTEIPETPFGKVMRAVVFEKRKSKLGALPLDVEVIFNINSIEEFDTLTKCAISFNLTKQTRFLHFDPSMYGDREETGKSLNASSNTKMFFSDWFKDIKAKNRTNVWFPYDPKRLSQIRARVVEK